MLVVPDFTGFIQLVDELVRRVTEFRDGEVASYIPQLARVDPEQLGVALCTIDGQVHRWGDASVDFCVQSCCKPISYCLALEEHGEDGVHRYIGREPSGVSFNELTLTTDHRPHNPMINAGAIMSCALVQPGRTMADRFEYVSRQWAQLAGGRRPRFDNAVYLSERATADRNFALGYFMREHGAFPPGTDLLETLEFYFQCCSLSVDCVDMALVGATLANAGVCPLSGQRVFAPRTVQNCLSLMHSCGMYDFSGEFAFTVGLPAKSGVAGALLVVVPNVLGLCIWSPRLDRHGNSVRGVRLCKELVRRFNLHPYDILTGLSGKIDPRQPPLEARAHEVQEVIWAASKGDLGALQRRRVQGADLELPDYDGRTALHLAAAEGQLAVVGWLLTEGVAPNPPDRFGHTPLDDAVLGTHDAVARLLEVHGGRRGSVTPQPSPTEPDDTTPVRNSADPLHGAVMMWAAATGDLEALRRSVARGATIDVVDYDLRTPMHLAAAEGHREIVEVLLAQGAAADPRDRWGSTPLDEATQNGHDDVAQVLGRSTAETGAPRTA